MACIAQAEGRQSFRFINRMMLARLVESLSFGNPRCAEVWRRKSLLSTNTV